MKLLASSDPHMKDGFANRVGVGKGGSEGLGWALNGAHTPETFEGPVGLLSSDTKLGCKSTVEVEKEAGAEAEAMCEVSNSGTTEAGTRAGEAGLGALFE